MARVERAQGQARGYIVLKHIVWFASPQGRAGDESGQERYSLAAAAKPPTSTTWIEARMLSSMSTLVVSSLDTECHSTM